MKLCQDCPKRYECLELCTEAELYVDQDHIGRDELPMEDMDDVDCLADWPDLIKTVHLTKREKEILTLLGRGLNRKDVCELLDITRGTLRWHVSQIKKKWAKN